MNFLSHLYLSGESEDILLGNFIGDYIKGKKYQSYPEGIAKGVVLHRHIDFFTDTHPIVKRCAEHLRPDFRRYAIVIIDMYFDHFLAKRWDEYSIYSLQDFTRYVHSLFISNLHILPERIADFLPLLIRNKRLESYARFDGLHDALIIMGQRTSLPEKADIAIRILKEHYDFFHQNHMEFFGEMITYVEDTFDIEIKKPV